MRLLSKFLIIGGVVILLLIFSGPFFWEAKYFLERLIGVQYQLGDLPSQGDYETTQERIITPVDKIFGIVIPKIDANAEIFPDIDPFNPEEFLPVLKKGVAHAKGTAFPGQGKRIYLFAHSADAFYNVGRYNAVFYLIGKLEKGDIIDIYNNNKLFQYKVIDKKVVSPQEVSYLEPNDGEELVLQTCYPPGTTLKRLIVIARPI